MKRALLILVVLLASGAAAHGQTLGGGSITVFSGTPTGSCLASQQAVSTSNGFLYTCFGGVWTVVNGNSSSTNLVISAGVFTAGQLNLVNQTLINGCNPTTQINDIQYTPNFTIPLVSCISSPTSNAGGNSSMFAVGGFAEGNNTASNPVASFYGQARTTVNGGHVITGNDVAQDIAGLTTGVQLVGREIDVQPYNAPSTYAGGFGLNLSLFNALNFTGNYGFSAVNVGCFNNPPTGTCLGTWNNAFEVQPGAIGTGSVFYIHEKATATSGANFGSPVLMRAFENAWVSGAATSLDWDIRADVASGANPAYDLLHIFMNGDTNIPLHHVTVDSYRNMDFAFAHSDFTLNTIAVPAARTGGNYIFTLPAATGTGLVDSGVVSMSDAQLLIKGLSYPLVTITPTLGAQGSVSCTNNCYTYYVVATDAQGLTRTVSSSLTAGPTTLDGSHFNTVAVAAWTSPVLPIGACTVYRARGANPITMNGSIGTIASCAAGGNIVDNGLTATAGSPPSDTSGGLTSSGALNAPVLNISGAGSFSPNQYPSYLNVDINGCNHTAIMYSVQFANGSTTGMESCVNGPNFDPGQGYNATTAIFATAISNSAARATTGTFYAFGNGSGQNAKISAINEVCQDAIGVHSTLNCNEIDVQPNDSAANYAGTFSSGLNISLVTNQNQGGGGTYPVAGLQFGSVYAGSYMSQGILFNSNSLGSASSAFVIQPIVFTATAGANYGTPFIDNFQNNYWNGSASVNERITTQLIVGSGTNPNLNQYQIVPIGGPAGQNHYLTLGYDSTTTNNMQLAFQHSDSFSYSVIAGPSTPGTTWTDTLPPATGTLMVGTAQNCGTTATCANTAVNNLIFIIGTVSLVSGTPSIATITGLPYTSTTSYVCTANNATTAANSLKVANASASSTVITGPNTVTDSVGYECKGT